MTNDVAKRPLSADVPDNLAIPDDLWDQLNTRGGFKSQKLGRNYTPEEKIQVATYWMVGYSSREISQLLDLPAPTVRTWMRTPWWKELVREVRKAKNEELDNQLTKIIHKTTRELEDRVDNGNYKYNPKTGELERVPMSSSELAKDGLGITFDKRQMTRGDPTSRVARDEQDPKQMLDYLAQQFVKMVKDNEPTPIEGEVVKDDNSDI